MDVRGIMQQSPNDSFDDPDKDIFQLKYVVIVLVLFASGLFILFISLILPKDGLWPLWSLFLNNVGAALIVSGVLSGASDLFLRKGFLKMNQKSTTKVLDEVKGTTLYLDKSTDLITSNLDESTNLITSNLDETKRSILSQIAFVKQEKDIGLVEILPDAVGYKYDNFLREQKELIIVLSDGRTWTSIYIPFLKERFKDKTKKTTIILLHPDSTEIEAWAHKTEYTVVGLKSKISQTIRALVDTKKEVEGQNVDIENVNLEILGHKSLNPYSVYLGDDQAIITLYFHAGNVRKFPLFKFHDTNDEQCMFRSLKESIGKLKKEAENIDYFKI